jgi:hypothetical protein
MIPTNRTDVFERALSTLQEFGEQTNIRGRFVALYLGLRRMGDSIAHLGEQQATAAGVIEAFLDRLYLKTHRPPPLNILTAPFGGSTSPNAPWSARTGTIAPGNRYPTNTWRNNFNIQKGIGCPASPEVIRQLLAQPNIRLVCPHISLDAEDRQLCSLQGTTYRGEEHSIWLRMAPQGGYQIVDLDDPATYRYYLNAWGTKIPVFPLLGVLYSNSPANVFPERDIAGIPEFAGDFHFNLDQLEDLFDCDPESPWNRPLLTMIVGQLPPAVVREPPQVPSQPRPQAPQPLPPAPEPALLNTGVGAELLVARNLQAHGWTVRYTGNFHSFGYDLLAEQGDSSLQVEVKSSVGPCTPELTEDEWGAAQRHGDEYILAVVDFFGSPGQRISYIRNPAATLVPIERQATTYRFAREELGTLAVDADFL